MTISPLLALGTLDHVGQPWTTLLGGEPAFTKPTGRSTIGVKSLVDRKHDPVLKLLVGDKKNGQGSEISGGGRVVSGLPIDLMTRSRLKISGKMVTGTLGDTIAGGKGEGGNLVGEVQLVIKVEQSLGERLHLGLYVSGMMLNPNTGNCPKYLNKKMIVAALPKPVLISNSLPLPEVALKLISKADLFFISSSNHGSSMGTNHRGGPPGFVRVLTNDGSSTSLVFPEYSGNRLYQTLGNLKMTNKAGLVFPDFETQDVLYVTGTTEILFGEAAGSVLPRSNLVVKVALTAARFVQKGLAFRGITDEFSPYNPPVRFLPTEHNALQIKPAATNAIAHAQLVNIQTITPTISCARFKVSKAKAAARWSTGQYVALSFEAELSAGYSHMRDSDPKSLNDDHVRTFTISSPPPALDPAKPNNADADEFEITFRTVGVVTRFLARQHPRVGLSLPLKGFGGSFAIPLIRDTQIPFVAGGIGITPLLAHLPSLRLATSTSLRLFWMVNIRDINLVLDTFQRHPVLASSPTRVKLFLSGFVKDTDLSSPQATHLQALYKLLSIPSPAVVGGSQVARKGNTEIFRRRMAAADIASELENKVKAVAKKEIKAENKTQQAKKNNPSKDLPAGPAGNDTWYICAAPTARKELLGWLAATNPEGKIKTVYEDFGY